MLTTPVQRTYPQTVGDLIDSFLSDLGLDRLKVGGGVLSFFEAVAQSQFRNSGDIFTLLAAKALDFAQKDVLEAMGRDEGVPKQTESPASGLVTITDPSFAKIATTIYQGTAAPIVGSTIINVSSAALFPATGSLYLGRGTTNYEGPIPYLSATNLGPYWAITGALGGFKK